MESQLSSSEPLGLTSTVALAFLRITTRSGIFSHPLAVEQALAYLDSWQEQPSVTWLSPGPNHWQIFKNLLVTVGTGGNLTSDVHLAALAIEHGCTIDSADYDFQRFPGIRHVNPLR